jgi:hypothetical protein
MSPRRWPRPGEIEYLSYARLCRGMHGSAVAPPPHHPDTPETEPSAARDYHPDWLGSSKEGDMNGVSMCRSPRGSASRGHKSRRSSPGTWRRLHSMHRSPRCSRSAWTRIIFGHDAEFLENGAAGIGARTKLNRDVPESRLRIFDSNGDLTVRIVSIASWFRTSRQRWRSQRSSRTAGAYRRTLPECALGRYVLRSPSARPHRRA